MAKQFGLGKHDRLKSRKQIDDLFAAGKSFNAFPLRIMYKIVPAANDRILQAGVTASKRYFKKAVERNRIKRLLREAYRLQKNELNQLLQSKQKSAFVFIIYTDKTICSFVEIEKTMTICMQKLIKAVHNENNT
ncbi:MAG TPA: ribonuclease P protein component [Flavisolibacter sp.]|jgi:ribonuclease P protein component|nr:ribonuclease P protein component [Flavisolibacter sp.]